MIKTYCLIISALFIVSACVTPYYGYSESEWNNLSKQEKSKIKSEYQQAIDYKNNQEHNDLIESHRQKTIDFGVDRQ